MVVWVRQELGYGIGFGQPVEEVPGRDYALFIAGSYRLDVQRVPWVRRPG